MDREGNIGSGAYTHTKASADGTRRTRAAKEQHERPIAIANERRHTIESGALCQIATRTAYNKGSGLIGTLSDQCVTHMVVLPGALC